MITARFDIEPRPKGRPRVYNGRGVTDPKTRAYESAISLLSARFRPAALLAGPLRIKLRFVFVAPKKPSRTYPCRADIDNLIKGVTDPLNGIFWEDDTQICEVEAVKLYDKTPAPKARIEMEVHEVTHG